MSHFLARLILRYLLLLSTIIKFIKEPGSDGMLPFFLAFLRPKNKRSCIRSSRVILTYLLFVDYILNFIFVNQLSLHYR